MLSKFISSAGATVKSGNSFYSSGFSSCEESLISRASTASTDIEIESSLA